MKRNVILTVILSSLFVAGMFLFANLQKTPTVHADGPSYDPYPWINTFYYNNLKDGGSFSLQDLYYVADHFDISSAKTWRYYDEMVAHNSHMESFPFTTLAYIAPWIESSLENFLNSHPGYTASQREGVYLHYQCDVTHGGELIRGCNLTNPETGACSGQPATGCSSSTATNLSESRVPDPDLQYQDLGWHVPNFNSQLYKDFGAWYIPDILSAYGQTSSPDGVFWDNIFYNGGLVHLDKTIEYWGVPDSNEPNHPRNLDYHAYYLDVRDHVEQNAGRAYDWLLNFNAMYWLRRNIDWVLPNVRVGTPENWVAPLNWGESSMPSWGLDCGYMDDAWSYTVGGGLKLAPYSYNIPFGGSYPDPDQRTKIFSIAKYYLVSNPNLYYGYKEDDVGNNLATQWNRMAEVDIGNPRTNPPGVVDFEGGTNTNKFFDWNNQTTQLNCTYFVWENAVFARHFENGLVIARWKGQRWSGQGSPPPGPAYNSYVDPRTYSLANPYHTKYFPIQPNGTIPYEPVTEITLTTNEAAELLQACAAGIASAVCGCNGVILHPGDLCAPNLLPTIEEVENVTMSEGEVRHITVHASDSDCPDGSCLTFHVGGASPRTFASIQNNGDGTATIALAPGYDQAGTHSYTVSVADTGTPPGTDATAFTVVVGNTNRAPVQAPIGNKTINEQDNLTFAVVATDADGDHLTLTASPLPNGANYTDHGDGTATFAWIPSELQAGTHVITFTASDGTATDTEDVVITVLDGIANCTPNWQCTDWSQCLETFRHRTCTDENHCGSDGGRPQEVEACDSIAPSMIQDLRADP